MNEAYFPMSKPMIGSVIPGLRQHIRLSKVVNYPDHSMNPMIKQRKYVDPITKFPDMNQEHGNKHSMLEKLRQLMSSNGPRHPHAAMGNISDVQTREGYQPQRENLDWRKM